MELTAVGNFVLRNVSDGLKVAAMKVVMPGDNTA